MRKIKTFILSILYLLFALIPKRKDIWIFGSRFGYKYDGNAKAFFEYIEHNAKDKIKVVWLTKSRLIYNKLNNDGYNCYMFNDFKGMYYGVVSGFYFYTVSRNDVPIYVTGNKKSINLKHGIPIKKHKVFKYSNLKLFFMKYLPFDNGRFPADLILSLNKENIKLFSQSYNVKEENVIDIGFPRNDMLSEYKNHDEKIIVYMPTYRQYKNLKKIDNTKYYDLFSEFEFIIEDWKKLLEKHHYKLIIKIHDHDQYKHNIEDIKLNYEIKNFENIIFLNDRDDNLDANDLLLKADILITDYSSAYIDFLLTQKPVIFSSFDLEEYIQEPGFTLNYDDSIAGKKCINWKEVLYESNELINGKDEFVEKRKEKLTFFHTYSDFSSSKRLYNYLVDYYDI